MRYCSDCEKDDKLFQHLIRFCPARQEGGNAINDFTLSIGGRKSMIKARNMGCTHLIDFVIIFNLDKIDEKSVQKYIKDIREFLKCDLENLGGNIPEILSSSQR